MSAKNERGRVILSINVGSSSLKFALFDISPMGENRLARGEIERIGLDGSRLLMRVGDAEPDHDDHHFSDHKGAIAGAFGAINDKKLPRPDAVGHRLVHGGPLHSNPERIDDALLRSLADVVPFAPLHLPSEILAIEGVTEHFPHLPQVACFDTAFHADLPEITRRLALPRSLANRGIRRYGFHGLSYEYVVATIGAKTLGRAVLVHLGNGASVAAVRDGAPIDTTMGLTPTGGIMSGTRTGDLDPGVLIHLLNGGFNAQGLEKIVDHESGLLGVSETTSDMKDLLEARGHDTRCALAVDMFAYQIRKTVGAFAAALGGIDTLVFTGGIGEHASPVRALACEKLAFLGIRLHDGRNAASESVISAEDSPCTVRVVATDEERMVARHTLRITSLE